ncbi:nitroreductase family protein [Olivibacter domesticus]|uniref:Nitroreductase n=1 Tax=Olivibacter domesticus TaxID=407022 RepID=A0A1H7YYB7_OLID1|nr:nitroreductase family protein [Olivibacter domesticus]SEM50901.1 Nitroreductase [Olivibacter domesticus]
MINRIKEIKKRVLNVELPKVCYKSRFLTSIYYFLFDKSFSRELQAVLTGRVKHVNESKVLKANYFLLVRNTHRLEKGLLMKPRRDIFGKDFIVETIDSFEGVWKSSSEGYSNPQMKWFYDVISEYFHVVNEGDKIIQREKLRFNNIISEISPPMIETPLAPSIPYFRVKEERTKIDYEEFYRLCKQRRSVRWFLEKKVPRELIDKAILAANQAPSACNRQPFEFRVFDDLELVRKVVDIPMGTKGYGHSIPVLIVLVGNLDAYFDERDRHIIYIDASLASMSFMFALETLGLSSCSINWPDIEEKEKKMETVLKLEKYQRPIMCIGVGYPDPEGLVAFSEKRPLHQIRRFN